MRERIVVLDGAMGTLIQRHELTEEQFRGERFAKHERDLRGAIATLESDQGSRVQHQLHVCPLRPARRARVLVPPRTTVEDRRSARSWATISAGEMAPNSAS